MSQAVYEAIDRDVMTKDCAHVDGHPTCPCGQELDACRREHCPRCGHRLTETARWHVA